MSIKLAITPEQVTQISDRELEPIVEKAWEAARRIDGIKGDVGPVHPAAAGGMRESIRRVLLGEITTPAGNHEEGFLKARIADGWTYGPKDNEAKTSPYIVSFDDPRLPADALQKNISFMAVVESEAVTRGWATAK